MSSKYPRDGRIYFRVKVPVDGRPKWVDIRTEFKTGQERAAQAALDEYDVRAAAGEAVSPDMGPVTVERFFLAWIKEREKQTAGWKNDRAAMKLHILPRIGHLRLDEVRPLHLIQIVKALRESHASKTVYNFYSTLCAFFRDACLSDLLPRHSSPCILTEHQLGPKMDADPEWRATAVFTRLEIERMISDSLVSRDRHVMYALESLAMLRHGEAAGLRWRLVDLAMEPLGRIVVARSYDKRTKTKVTRHMPIHPTLAAILSEWRLSGWAAAMGRQPTPDDLVVPRPPTIRRPAMEGRMRTKRDSREKLMVDLAALGFRHRRGHDLRHTGISLARSDGAAKDILRRGTHKAPKEIMDQYTHFEWEVLCREVAKLKISRRVQGGKVLALPLAAASGGEGLHGSSDEFATMLATSPRQPPMFIAKTALGPPGFEPGTETSFQIVPAPTTFGHPRISRGYEWWSDDGYTEKPAPAASSGSKVANHRLRARLRHLRVAYGLGAA